MDFNPNTPCSYPGCNKEGCHPSWHSANRVEIDELAERYTHPTLVLKALRVRAKWRNDQVPKKPRTSDITGQPLSQNSEPNNLSQEFILDRDDPSFVTCTCQWLLKSDDVREVKGCFIGFHANKDLGLIILHLDATGEGEPTRVPLLCASKYLPSELQKTRKIARSLSIGKNNFSVLDIAPRKITKDDGTICNLLDDGLFNRTNKLICDDRLIASFEAGLVHVKRRKGRKYSFRFAAKKDFWFEEGGDDIHNFVLEVHRNSAKNGVQLTQTKKGNASSIVMEIAQLAKYRLANNDIHGVNNFLTELQNIGEREPPSLYDKSLLYALCKKDVTSSPVGKVIPCRVRAEYIDDDSKSWSYLSPLCLCDVNPECLEKSDKQKKVKQVTTHIKD